MPGSGPAEQLRGRASVLRANAAKVESAAARDLYRRAGSDVWLGPTPAHCLDELLRIRGDLQRAADTLRDAARTLEQLAGTLQAVPVGHTSHAAGASG